MKKAILLAVWLVPAAVLAQSVPGTMTYQGRLLDSSGNPVTGSPSVRFTIYDAATNGTQLWTETRTVQLTNGFYAVQLGSQTAFSPDVFNGNARWLAVQVGTDAEMTPRQYIATVPYAFRALNANTAANVNVAAGGSVTVAVRPARIPGLVVGGYRITGSCSSSGCGYGCSAQWGDGRCTSTSTGDCAGNPAGSQAGVARIIDPATVGSQQVGTRLCIQQ